MTNGILYGINVLLFFIILATVLCIVSIGLIMLVKTFEKSGDKLIEGERR